MRPETLQAIADAGESDTVEFKKSTALKQPRYGNKHV